MDSREKDLWNERAIGDSGVDHAVPVDPDCDAPLDDIIEESLTTSSGMAGWDHGLLAAEGCSERFVADLLAVYGAACNTAAGRLRATTAARPLMTAMAHACVKRTRVALDRDSADGSSADAWRSYKRGLFAGFLYGLADAVSRGVHGRSLVEA